MSEAITSVRFAGASMECVALMQPLIVRDDGYPHYGSALHLTGNADVYMYRHDIRAVNFGDSHVWVYDTQGNRFRLDVGDDNPLDVAVAIGAWRMAASERWEAETRARPANRQARPKPKPKAAIVRPSSDDDDHG